jgi:AAA+ ATPase superfamily predicted ATPase
MFIGRVRELKQLNDLYHANAFRCVVIYGRRRTGKTALINEFMKDKEAIFFTAMETSGYENLIYLG